MPIVNKDGFDGKSSARCGLNEEQRMKKRNLCKETSYCLLNVIDSWEMPNQNLVFFLSVLYLVNH